MCFKPFKRFKIKVRQSLRRDVFYHDFSGCCHTVPVNKDQFFLFSRSRVLLFQNLQFYTSPSISRKKIKKKIKHGCDHFNSENLLLISFQRILFSHDVCFNIFMHTFDIISFIYYYFSKYFSSTTSLDGYGAFVVYILYDKMAP